MFTKQVLLIVLASLASSSVSGAIIPGGLLIRPPAPENAPVAPIYGAPPAQNAPGVILPVQPGAGQGVVANAPGADAPVNQQQQQILAPTGPTKTQCAINGMSLFCCDDCHF